VSLRQRAALVAVTSVFMGFGGFAQIRSSDYTTVVQQICRGYAAGNMRYPMTRCTLSGCMPEVTLCLAFRPPRFAWVPG
jgi:hypothetical protein